MMARKVESTPVKVARPNRKMGVNVFVIAHKRANGGAAKACEWAGVALTHNGAHHMAAVHRREHQRTPDKRRVKTFTRTAIS